MPPSAMASPDTASPRLPLAEARALHVIDSHHATRLLAFILLYLAGAAAAVSLARYGVWGIATALPFYLLAAASLHGLSLFTHEAVHGTLSRNRVWNAMLGAVCAWPVLQNYSAYRVLHLRHHEHLGQEGDPDHYPNYARWSWLVFLMNWGRLLVGYPVYIVAIPILGFRQGTARERGAIAAEVAAVSLFVVGLCQLSWPVACHAWLVPMVIINTLVNIRGMSQHTLLERYHGHPVLGTRSILTNRVTAFFMCNENYHLEHHLYPGVPWYHLPRVHALLGEDLRRRGAPFIDSYFEFVRAFVAGSFRRSPWGPGEPVK